MLACRKIDRTRQDKIKPESSERLGGKSAKYMPLLV
jgi:hypothetical protein